MKMGSPEPCCAPGIRLSAAAVGLRPHHPIQMRARPVVAIRKADVSTSRVVVTSHPERTHPVLRRAAIRPNRGAVCTPASSVIRSSPGTGAASRSLTPHHHAYCIQSVVSPCCMVSTNLTPGATRRSDRLASKYCCVPYLAQGFSVFPWTVEADTRPRYVRTPHRSTRRSLLPDATMPSRFLRRCHPSNAHYVPSRPVGLTAHGSDGEYLIPILPSRY